MNTPDAIKEVTLSMLLKAVRAAAESGALKVPDNDDSRIRDIALSLWAELDKLHP